VNLAHDVVDFPAQKHLAELQRDLGRITLVIVDVRFINLDRLLTRDWDVSGGSIAPVRETSAVGHSAQWFPAEEPLS
jgi:hypothetical protein